MEHYSDLCFLFFEQSKKKVTNDARSIVTKFDINQTVNELTQFIKTQTNEVETTISTTEFQQEVPNGNINHLAKLDGILSEFDKNNSTTNPPLQLASRDTTLFVVDLDHLIDKIKHLVSEANTSKNSTKTLEKVQSPNASELTVHLNTLKVLSFSATLNTLCNNNYFVYPDNSVIPKEIVFEAFGNFLNYNLSATLNDVNTIPIQKKSERAINKIKLFHEYLLHDKKKILASAIKAEFSKEKGKTIKMMIHLLENRDTPLLTIGYGYGKAFYNTLKDYFKTDIGTYQSIFNYKVNEETDKKELKQIQFRINHLLTAI